MRRKAPKRQDAQWTTAERFIGEFDGRGDPLARLTFPSVMTATHVLRRHDAADWSNVDIGLMRFAARFIERARNRGIPLYVRRAFVPPTNEVRDPYCEGRAVAIEHTEYTSLLTSEEWGYLAKLGHDALFAYNRSVLKKHRLDIVWAGPTRPWEWTLNGWRFLRPPELLEGPQQRHTPRYILRHL